MWQPFVLCLSRDRRSKAASNVKGKLLTIRAKQLANFRVLWSHHAENSSPRSDLTLVVALA